MIRTMFESRLHTILFEDVTANNIITAINRTRTQHQLRPATGNPELRKAAQAHALNMAYFQKFGHKLPESDYPTFHDRMQLANFSYSDAGEVLAAGFDDPSRVVRLWLNSPTHREIILHPDITDIGASVQYARTGKPYICAVLGVASGGDNDYDDDDGPDLIDLITKYGKKAAKSIWKRLTKS